MSEERSVLKKSIVATLIIAVTGIGFGSISGSFAIIFDGLYSLIDAMMSFLSLIVVHLITTYATSDALPTRLKERFTLGFWHLEPLVLGLDAILLMGAIIYALMNAIISLMDGGRVFEFSWAILYALLSLVICLLFILVERHANRSIRSEFIRLDIQSWIMSAAISFALLIAFLLGYAIQKTSWEWISPYIDPTIVTILCLCILPLPVSIVRKAVADILLMTPPELKQHIDRVAQDIVIKYRFVTYRAYVARVGRSKEIELYFIVPKDTPPKTIAQWDALREEIGAAIGDKGPDRWLTIVFTGDLAWAE